MGTFDNVKEITILHKCGCCDIDNGLKLAAQKKASSLKFYITTKSFFLVAFPPNNYEIKARGQGKRLREIAFSTCSHVMANSFFHLSLSLFFYFEE